MRWRRMVLQVLQVCYKCATEHFDQRKVVPLAERVEVMRRYHEDAGHAGGAAMYLSISRRHFWPRMGADCREHVSKCHDLARNQVLPRVHMHMRPMPLGQFGEMWGMIDSAGPLPKSKSGNAYLIIACSYYGKWPEAIAVPKLDSSTTAKFFREQVICRYGPPEVVVHDWGKEYQGCFAKLLAKHNIQSRKTAAYHPQGNGASERTMKTIKERLRKSGGDQVETSWDEQQPEVLWSMRMHKQASSPFSPFTVMFGREPPALSGRKLSKEQESEVNTDGHANDDEWKLHQAVTTALDAALRVNVQNAQEKQKKEFHQRNKNRRDTPRVPAMSAETRCTSRCASERQLATRWRGPTLWSSSTRRKTKWRSLVLRQGGRWTMWSCTDERTRLLVRLTQ